MSKKVVHHQLGMGIYPQGHSEEAFPDQVIEILRLFLDQAHENWGATIDWSTFRAEAGEQIEVASMDGSRSPLEVPVHFYVDAVEIKYGEDE